MPDPYALDPQSAPDPAPAGPPTDGALRSALWTLLALSVGGSALTSSTTVPVWVNVSVGLVTISTIAALVVLHRRGR